MTMLADATDVTRELLTVMGEPVAVTRGGVGPASFLAFVDQAIQEVGQHFRAYGNKHVIAMLRADWVPVRGDVFAARDFTQKVEEIVADDGVVITVVLHG